MLWKLFSSNDLLPQGFCYQWNSTLVWLHVISDTLIAVAYFSIPPILIYLVKKRRGLPFDWVFVCFGTFIVACGATHVMEVVTLWVPVYWIAGGVKVITALASLPTAALLMRAVPRVLSLPSTDEMRAANEELNRQAATLKKAEERFRQMADNIQEIFWIMDSQSKEVSYVSPAFEQICELPLDSLYANPTSYRELIHAQDRQRVLAALEKLESSNRFDEEFRIVCPSGAVKWIRAIGFTAKDAAGNVKTLVGTAQEITARKEMEVVLRESEDRYRDLVEHSTDLICTHNLQGRLLSVNELPVKLLGYSREELLNKPMRDFLLPEARAQFDQTLLSIERDGFAKGLMVVLTKTGERRIWEYHNTLRIDGVAAPVVRGIAHDVTEQRRVEKALRLSEEKFSKAFHSSPVEIVITTLQEGRFLDVNESFERNTGFTRDEAIGHTSVELGLWANPEERAPVVKQITKHGGVRNLEMQFLTKSGETRVKLYSAEPIEIGGKQCLLAVLEDITLRKQMEEELRLSEEKFSKAFRCSPTIVSISTLQEGLFLDVNETFERHSGYTRDEIIGHTELELELWIDPRERAALVDAVRMQGSARSHEIHLRTKAGQVMVILLSVELIELSGEQCLLMVGQDISDRKRAEDQLQQLSGGLLRLQDEERGRIARHLHDSTGQNLAALAMSLRQLYDLIPASGRKLRKLVAQCQASTEGCMREVRSLSYVLHPPMLDQAGLEDAIRHYAAGFTKRTGIEIELEVSSGIARMRRDRELALFRVIQECLINIHRHSGSQTASIHLLTKPGVLSLEVRDNGCGIHGREVTHAGDIPAIFGVGIPSMCERVKEHGGRLDIETNGGGTTVRVTIPTHD